MYVCRINPSAVLDFLWACLHKPCLWQERVKKEAVVNSSISLVSVMTHMHICSMLLVLVSGSRQGQSADLDLNSATNFSGLHPQGSSFLHLS